MIHLGILLYKTSYLCRYVWGICVTPTFKLICILIQIMMNMTHMPTIREQITNSTQPLQSFVLIICLDMTHGMRSLPNWAIIGRGRLEPHQRTEYSSFLLFSSLDTLIALALGGLLPDAMVALDLPYVQGGVIFITYLCQHSFIGVLSICRQWNSVCRSTYIRSLSIMFIIAIGLRSNSSLTMTLLTGFQCGQH